MTIKTWQERLNGDVGLFEKPSGAIECAMQAEIDELRAYSSLIDACLKEWLDKTEWVQKECNEGKHDFLGMHRADSMKALVNELRAQLEALQAPEELPPLGDPDMGTIQLSAPPPPHECKTEAEKTAYAFGWWKALEAARINAPTAALQSDAIARLALMTKERDTLKIKCDELEFQRTKMPPYAAPAQYVNAELVEALQEVVDAVDRGDDCIALWADCFDTARKALDKSKEAQTVGINGLTKADTDASMSMRGLSNPVPKEENERLRKSLARCLAEAEEWLDDARGCKPADVMDYDGWTDEARRLLAQNAVNGITPKEPT